MSFYSGAMFFEYDIFNSYEYYLRLDCDSRIASRIPRSLFSQMKSSGAWYGYFAPANQLDHPFVTRGLHEYLRTFFKSRGIKYLLKFSLLVRRDAMFYTNFEIGFIPALKSPDFEAAFTALDQSGGFMLNRWGDAPIKYALAKTLLPSRRLKGFYRFSYQHGHTYPATSPQYWHLRFVRKVVNTLVRKAMPGRNV